MILLTMKMATFSLVYMTSSASVEMKKKWNGKEKKEREKQGPNTNRTKGCARHVGAGSSFGPSWCYQPPWRAHPLVGPY